jgi:flagellar hook-associated protein FlgK
MSGLFGTLNIFKRASAAQQYAVNVTAHNISNATTDGYSRQRVTMEASRPEGNTSLDSASGPGQLGTGVEVTEITRVRDIFLDTQIRDELSISGQYKARDEFLSEIETLSMEPSYDDGSGLSILMNRMWDSWQQLENGTENSNTKTSVIEATRTFTDSMNNMYSQLDKLKTHSDDLIEGKVTEFNNLVTQIEDLNRQIAGVKISNNNPNDFMDKQDLFIDQLAEMADIEVTRDKLGQVTIKTTAASGGVTIVGGGKQTLTFNRTNPGKILWDNGSGTLVDAALSSGSISGYISITSEINGYQKQLDTLAKAVAYSVNLIHNDGHYEADAGYTSYLPVFVAKGTGSDSGISAANITVNSSLIADPSALRAGKDDANLPGDNSRAIGISSIRDKTFQIANLDYSNRSTILQYDAANMTISNDDSGTTIDGYYRNFIVRLGSSASQAKNMVSNQQELLNQLDVRKESISGVNTDEETTNLIQYQHALEAAFKGISVIDELLQSVINLIR